MVNKIETEHALDSVNVWHKVLVYGVMSFVVVTFFLWARLKGGYSSTTAYEHAVAGFWASLTFTAVLGVLSITVKKLYNALVLLNRRK